VSNSILFGTPPLKAKNVKLCYKFGGMAALASLVESMHSLNLSEPPKNTDN